MKNTVVTKTLRIRGDKLISKIPLNAFGGFPFLYLAGNSLNAVRGDLDLFPRQTDGHFPLDLWKKFPEGWKPVANTRNATTMVGPNHVVLQLCNYLRPSLSQLVRSFDFAHIQVGVSFSTLDSRIDDVYFSDEWLEFRALGDSKFTGSGYPLSSLIRLMKYRSRRDISRGRAIASALEIVEAIVKRGFYSYADFKDQLDAVDLGLLPEEMEAISQDSLFSLYKMLTRDERDIPGSRNARRVNRE